MFVLVVLLFLVSRNQLDAKVCHSPKCVKSSEYILSKMDLSADPCEDFYQYTCGNWINVTDIPKDKEKSMYNTLQYIYDRNVEKMKAILDEGDTYLNGTHSVALEKLHNFYLLCITEKTKDNKGVEEVVQFILDMFSWNVTSSFGVTWSEKSWDFQTALTVNHAYEFSAFFLSSIDYDSSTVKFIPSETDSQLAEGRKARLLKFGLKVGELLGGKEASVAEEMTKIYYLQVKLSNLSESNNNKSVSETMNLASFQTLIGNMLNVTNYLKDRFGDFSINDFQINVTNKDYFGKLHSIISMSPKSTLANYIVWNALLNHIEYLPPIFLQAYDKFYLDDDQEKLLKNTSRKDYCFNLFHRNGVLAIALYALFIDKSPFSKESRNEIYTIVREVRNGFQREVAELPWLDEDTKEWVIEKASDIETNIGYVDWVDDATLLDELFEDIAIIPGQFLQSSLEVRMVTKGQSLGVRDDWRLMALFALGNFLVPNAFYYQNVNEFFITAGLLQKPAFTKEFPMSFNFGSIGFSTGHEITHGFDNSGILMDKNGTPSLWWKNQTAYTYFNEQRNCLVQQYSNYSVGFNSTIAGNISKIQGQNIADNGGIYAAYNALKNWKNSQDSSKLTELPGLSLSQEQMFFVGFGQGEQRDGQNFHPLLGNGIENVKK
ncbi:endothelin-converting enzyme 1-like isoform X2 [Ostrea edulis]|uniref:endothelin-converting enzyme 1-like isoform X2 n=1 Tax=Ostrea edulis TaxID=37623 RepID=UPI0024AF858D|nr:endothelin-converting enzyme 1-like isoform X2 [Ostrea edulis]